MKADPAVVDLAGIGIGPFNLSLAALADGVEGLSAAFFDRKPAFDWHPGLAFSQSVLQTSFLKDLVTPVRPTSSWSFLNYLVQHGRFYDFLAGRFGSVSRLEFTAYMAWAAERLASCHFDSAVVSVEHDPGGFLLHLPSGPAVRARAISVGTGHTPYMPPGTPVGRDCLHVSSYLQTRPRLAGRRVALVGGGQSGAEVMLDLLQGADQPAEIVWLTRRSGFWHLQEAGLIDQFFTPAYQRTYRQFSPVTQARELVSQKLASDGITPETADQIYAALYHRRHIEKREGVSLRPARTVTRINRWNNAFELEAQTHDAIREIVSADVVLLATGYRPAVPDCLHPLHHRLEREPDGALALGDNYRVNWDGPAETPIYAMNHGRMSYGIIDPQLSMMAWRSAVILNDLTGRQIFDLGPGASGGLVDWSTPSATCQCFSAMRAVG
jgi:lysine N6-hydroxylase